MSKPEFTDNRQRTECALNVALLSRYATSCALEVRKRIVDCRAFLILLCKPYCIAAEKSFPEKRWIAVDNEHLALLVAVLKDLDEMAENIWMQKLSEVIDEKSLLGNECLEECGAKGFRLRTCSHILQLSCRSRRYE